MPINTDNAKATAPKGTKTATSKDQRTDAMVTMTDAQAMLNKATAESIRQSAEYARGLVQTAHDANLQIGRNAGRALIESSVSGFCDGFTQALNQAGFAIAVEPVAMLDLGGLDLSVGDPSQGLSQFERALFGTDAKQLKGVDK